MTILRGLALGLLAMALIASGCSRDTSPIEPAGWEPTGTAASDSHNLFGLYTFICNPVEGTVEVMPLREAGMHLNALKFLEPPPFLYLTLESPPQFNGNILDVDIGLRNPYAGFVQFTGFDVCGIVFTHGSESGFADPEIVMAGKGDTRLLNADGYTRWWNPAEFPHGDTIFNYIDGMLGTPSDTADFNCTINGYKYFADGLGKDDPLTELDLSKRGMFSAGKKNIRHYKIDISGGLIFNYAVDACWMKPQGSPPYDAPDDFPPGANRSEAWHISVTELENSLYCEEAEGYAGGELKLLIDVWDHFNAGLNEVYAESLAGLPIAAALTPIGGGEGYSTYELDLTGEGLKGSGEAELLISVQSEVSGYGDILPGIPACAYFKHTVHVRKPLGWARTWGGIGLEFANGVAVDTTGNIYVTGVFHYTVDFDPGPGVDEHTAVNCDDAYLCKYDSSGNFLWARTWGGILSEYSRDVAVDGYGNVYVVGGFMLTVDFDPGPGVDEHTANIDPVNPDFFLSKFDSDGNFIWARTWGGDSGNVCQGVAADISGNAYVIGRFDGMVDFDPGPETDEHAAPSWNNAFLSKFDSNGDFQWVRVWGNNDHFDYIEDIAVDGSCNVYVTGDFTGIVDFDPGPGVDEHVSGGSYDAFVSKFDSNGDFHGARTWGGESHDSARGIAVGGSGNVYITGGFLGTVDFDPGPGTDEHTATSELYSDAYLSKIDTNGVFQWVRTWGGPDYIRGHAVAVDDSEAIYASGPFRGTVDFDPGPGLEEHTSLDVSGWLSKFAPNGDFIWARVWGGNDQFQVEAVAADSMGAAYVTGRFKGTADFDPGPGIYERTWNGGYDAFLSKFPPDGNW